jgi:predicted RNA-binding Zn ribbon-like protein
VEIALALIDVIRSGEQQRLRVCEAPDCEGLFVDFSRNGSKRFCSVRCGNRVNQLAFRARAAEE